MQSILTFFVALAMMSSTTACSLNETPAENKAETPPIKQEQTIEEEQSQAEQKIETQQQEKKEPIQKVEQPQQQVEQQPQEQPKQQQPIETKPQAKPKEQPKQQQVVDEDGFISWGTVEMPTETDGNDGGLENNWDTVGYRYKDGEIEEVMQKVADYCDSLGFTYDESLTQFNSIWYPPASSVSESPNGIIRLLKHHADKKNSLQGDGSWHYKVGISQEDGIDGYFVFLWLT